MGLYCRSVSLMKLMMYHSSSAIIPQARLAVLLAATIASVLSAVQPAAAQRTSVIVLLPIIRNVSPPTRVASDNVNTFVLAPGDHSIAVFDSQGSLRRRIGIIGQGPGELYRSNDFAVGSNGRVWIAEQAENRLQSFTPDGLSDGVLTVPAPRSIAITPSGEILIVSNQEMALFSVYSLSGDLIRKVDGIFDTGTSDKAPNAFRNRGRLTVDPTGEIFYLFLGLRPPRVLRLDHNGRPAYILPIGSRLADILSTRPAVSDDTNHHNLTYTLNALAIDPRTGHIWIAPAAPELYEYLPSGVKIAEYGLRGVDGKAYTARDLWITKSGQGLAVAGNNICTFMVPGA